MCKRLGPSPERFIQRWNSKSQFVSVTQSCGVEMSLCRNLHVIVMDVPDAEWIYLTSEIVLADIVPAAGEWMTDGFIMLDRESSSLLSVDVEEKSGRSVIETTVIGEGFRALRGCYERGGPSPLPIVTQKA
jgi:hypothetical protein